AHTPLSTLSLHDALPISDSELYPVPHPRLDRHVSAIDRSALVRNTILHFSGAPALPDDSPRVRRGGPGGRSRKLADLVADSDARSEEHTSELQSRSDLVC